jgi:thiamine monophosphate synthase
VIPRLLLLTDRSQLRLGRGLVRTVRECAEAGLAAVVVREHDLEPSARPALVRALVSIPGLTVLSSRIPDPAAHGLHLASHQSPPAAHHAGWTLPTRHSGGQADLGPPERRDDVRRPPPWGRSCHSRAEVARSAEQGASWATLSPYAASASKPGYGPSLPPDAFEGHRVPVLALGGIDESTAARARAAGADGVAVMGAVMRAPDPAELVSALLRAVETPHDVPLLRCAPPNDAAGTPE